MSSIVTVPEGFDWFKPNYSPVFQERARRLYMIRSKPEMLPGLKRFYRDNPAQFIVDWGLTSDPRHVEIGLPVSIPFILFPRQIEWIDWILERWRAREPGVTVKSREMGVSWLSIALTCTLCLFYDDMAVGFGSRKAELVDKLGDPKSLFWKARMFLETLPDEFTGGWRAKPPFSAENLIRFPQTGASLAGEGGDEIGRGARTGMYIVDESSSLQHPILVDAALSQTTNCRQDISTPKGMANSFAQKVHSWPDHRVFRFHWRDDPRKDDAWYAKQVELLDPVTLAQEVDMDFAASVTGLLIPTAWVQASIDAHVTLGIVPSGARTGALDVADEGLDKNAFAVGHGIVLTDLEEWSGKGDDIFGTVEKAFSIADTHGLSGFQYDADGLGAGVRGDSRVINDRRREQGVQAGSIMRPLDIVPFRGSGAVLNPDGKDVPGRTNADFFANQKAQSWWTLRRRFQETYRAVNGQPYQDDLLISIPKAAPNDRYDEAAWAKIRGKLVAELSQPTFSLNGTGKVVVDKAPDGTRSPNLADAVMILMGRHKRAMRISDEAMRAA